MSNKTTYKELLRVEDELQREVNECVSSLEKAKKSLYDYRKFLKGYEENHGIEDTKKPIPEQEIVLDNTLNKVEKTDPENDPVDIFKFPKKYKAKVKYILELLGGSAESPQVRDKWIELEPSMDGVKADRETRKKLFELKKDGVLTSRPSGEGNKFVWAIK